MMEHKFLSGVSIFDFLAMVIPGGVIIAFLGGCLEKVPFVINVCDKNAFTSYIILCVIAYLIGLIHNAFMDFLFNWWFRNNAYYIQYFHIITTGNKERNIVTAYKKCYCKYCIIRSICIFIKAIKKCSLCGEKTSKVRKTNKNRNIRREYYRAYYYISNHSINSSISIMECQVTFIRNMLIPAICICFHYDMFKCVLGMPNIQWGYFFIAIIALFITMISRQNKIYRRVWEDYLYLKYQEEEEEEEEKYKNNNLWNKHLIQFSPLCWRVTRITPHKTLMRWLKRKARNGA